MEASSIPSDPQRRKPDDQTCCDGVVEPSTGDGWPILGVGGFRRPMYACSSPSSRSLILFPGGDGSYCSWISEYDLCFAI